MITALNGLPSKYDMIKTVLIARDTSISFKEFGTQLLVAEQSVESPLSTLHTPMVAMIGHTSSSSLNLGTGILPTPSTVPISPSGLHANAQPSSSMSKSLGKGQFSGSRPSHGVFQRLVLCQNAKFATSVDIVLSTATIGMFLLNTQPHHLLLSVKSVGNVAMGLWIAFIAQTTCIKDKATNQVLLRGRSNKGIYPILGAVSPINYSSLAYGSFSPATAYVGQQIKSSMWHSRLGHPTNECHFKESIVIFGDPLRVNPFMDIDR
ncbi:unnamed protein product [Prunus armeniaca]